MLTYMAAPPLEGVQDSAPMEQGELVERFRAGDPEAIRALYRLYAGPVATIARATVGPDQALIDDIVQQVFTKAWQAAAQFSPGRDLAPWLYTIARRTAIDAVRAERRPTRGDHEPEVEVGIVDAESMERTWEAFQIRRAVDALPPDERDVVRLGYHMGMTHQEIAGHLNVPVGTVKSRSSRAHRRLGAALAHLRSNGSPPSDPGPGAWS
jgi:RNA polymerase sigma-70 factor, ECF subfamily